MVLKAVNGIYTTKKRNVLRHTGVQLTLNPHIVNEVDKMLELGSVKEIIKILEWIATFGSSDVKEIKKDIDNLITELSKSLKNLWDVVRKVTSIKEDVFSKESFETIYDDFVGFYVGENNISLARTHCGEIEGTLSHIKFKISKILNTDMGKWNDVDDKLNQIVDRDGNIIYEYDASINALDSSLKEIKILLESNNIDSAKIKYFSLKSKLESDIRLLNDGVKVMEKASSHIKNLAG